MKNRFRVSTPSAKDLVAAGGALAARADQVIRAVIVAAALGSSTVARPRAGRLAARGLGGGRRRRSRAASAANAGNEAVAESAERRLEVSERRGRPVGSLGAGNGTGAGEGNVEDVVGIVGRVAVDGVAIAGSAEGVRDLADQWWAVIAVGIAPDTVELMLMLVEIVFQISLSYKCLTAYHLVATNHGNDRQRVNTS